jgi:hypothetical protein
MLKAGLCVGCKSVQSRTLSVEFHISWVSAHPKYFKQSSFARRKSALSVVSRHELRPWTRTYSDSNERRGFGVVPDLGDSFSASAPPDGRNGREANLESLRLEEVSG